MSSQHEGAFERGLAEVRKRKLVSGVCNWCIVDSLRSQIRASGVPSAPGAYVLTAHSSSQQQVAYIGRAGTMIRSGRFMKQGLRGRLTAKAPRGEPRERAFKRLLEQIGCDRLGIEWFITWDSGHCLLPALLEAELMQAYVEEHGCLPPWNTSF